MKMQVLVCACVLIVCCFGMAHGGGPERDYTGLGVSIGMLAPMGDFGRCYDPSAVFGLAMLTRYFEMEVQYSSLRDEFAEEYDVPSWEMWMIAPCLRLPLSEEFSLTYGWEFNWYGADYARWIEDTFYVRSTKTTDNGVTGGAELAVPLSDTASFLLRLEAHWFPNPEMYFVTFGVGVGLSSWD